MYLKPYYGVDYYRASSRKVDAMSLRMNLNFNIESVSDLERVTEALKQATTLQAKIKLENQIRELKAEKEHVSQLVQKLRDEQQRLEKKLGKDLGVENAVKFKDTDKEDTESGEPSSFDNEADRLIDEVGEVEPVVEQL